MTIVVAIALIALGVAGAMTLAWWLVISTGRSGWADTIWSATVGAAGVAAALVPLAQGASMPRPILVAVLIAIWSIRLATHIGRRTIARGDDPRYAQLRKEWGEAAYPRRLFVFLQIQAGVAFVLAAAALAIASNPAPIGLGDAAGLAVALLALLGEAIADRQLRDFKADPANNGKVCDAGLWSLSRHPNYFFEWLFWLALVPIGLSLDYTYGWLGFAAPLMMYILLVHVSGVPPLEAHMLRSRPDAFRDYQQRVRAFWPLPRHAPA